MNKFKSEIDIVFMQNQIDLLQAEDCFSGYSEDFGWVERVCKNCQFFRSYNHCCYYGTRTHDDYLGCTNFKIEHGE